MRKRDLLIGGVIGAAVGSLVTAMSTPKSGEEMREGLRDTPDRAKSVFYEKLGEAKAEKRHMKNKTKDYIED